jgi:tetratricopeptide (TPR) repeat protein
MPGAGAAGGAGDAHAGHMPGAAPTGNNPGMTGRYRRNPSFAVFVRGLAAAKAGASDAEKSIAALQAIRKQMIARGDAYPAKSVEIMELEVAAAFQASKGGYDEAITMMKKATSLEEEMSPPSGPPDLIKPSHELFGEILLQAGRSKEAADQFRVALARQPNRARSLLGAARAAAQSGDVKGAIETYASFLRIWEQADPQLRELKEAREYEEKGKANSH